MFAYCLNNPMMGADSNGEFMISTAIIIGTIVGATIGAVAGGAIAYNSAKKEGVENKQVIAKTALGAACGTVVGGALGAAVGYGVGYLAGGTYANGLAAKSINNGVNTFFSNTNKVHHTLSKPMHNLSKYSNKEAKKLMKHTLKNGKVGPYKGVQSAYWDRVGSEVTFNLTDSGIKISNMWIR